MHVNTYLYFKGDCEAAFRFYEQTIGARVLSLFPYSDSPSGEPVAEEWRGKVMHSRLSIGDTILMGSDMLPGRYQPPAGVSLSIAADSLEEAERMFHALAAGGTIGLPIQQTFWAARFGMLTDRFGVPWMVSYEAPS